MRSLHDYNRAIQKLAKIEDGRKKQVLKDRLLREAIKDLEELEFHGFKILLNLWTDQHYRDRVLFADQNRQTTMPKFFNL